MMIYGVYEADEYEQCVFVGTMRELVKMFNRTERSLSSSIARHKKIEVNGHRRYYIYSLYKEAKDEQI